MDSDQVVCEQRLALLRAGNAHRRFDEALSDFPAERFNVKPANVLYTSWPILEQMRQAQGDRLALIRNPNHVSLPWPAGYWSQADEEADRDRWEQTIRQFRADLAALGQLVVGAGPDL